jgi:hypothetical protein
VQLPSKNDDIVSAADIPESMTVLGGLKKLKIILV